MRFTRLIITALNRRWLQNAVNEICGYGTSVIGCDAEVGFEGWVDSADTFDGRPGASVLLFALSTEALQKATFTRTKPYSHNPWYRKWGHAIGRHVEMVTGRVSEDFYGGLACASGYQNIQIQNLICLCRKIR